MKVLCEGFGEWRPWWIGLRLTCATCGREVLLEEGDDMDPNWCPSTEPAVIISCKRCGNLVRKERR